MPSPSRARARRRSTSAFFGLATLVVALSACGAGCTPELPPSTLAITGVQPREVDVGDRLEVLGAGFPVKRTAKIVLRGHVHRPGASPEPLTLTLETEARSEGRLELPVTEALATRIAGPAEATPHATFRGDVLVTFPPSEPAAAPLAGKATGIVLDVRPAAPHASVIARLDDAGRKVADLLGIELSKRAPASGGVLVASVREGSAASRAGIAEGDVIVEVDGVRVSSIADLAPPPESAMTIVLRKGGLDQGGPGGGDDLERTRTVIVPLEGWSQRVPRSSVAAFVIVAASGLVLVLAMLPASSATTSLERRLAAAYARRRRRRPRLVSSIAGSLGEGDVDPATLLGPAALAGGCAAVVLAKPLFGVDLDLALASGVSVASAVALAPLRVSAGRTIDLVRHAIPAALATACAIVASGSLRLDDVLRAQGALPWQWLVFRTPATLVACASFVASAALVGARDPIAALEGPRPSAPLAHRALRSVTAVLVSVLFLGGPLVPWGREADGLLRAAAVIVLLAKALAVRAAMSAIEAAFADAVDAARLGWRRLVPWSVAALVAQTAWVAASPSPAFGRATTLALFALACAIASAAALRAIAAVRRVGHEQLDPRI